MKVTPSLKDRILKELRLQRKTREQLADICGKKPSWASKLLSDNANSLKAIDEDDAVSIENWLGIPILSSAVRTESGVMSETASAFAKLIDEHDDVRRMAAILSELVTPRERGPRYIPKNEMAALGQEIIKLAFANEDKPGKVAREVLKLLA